MSNCLWILSSWIIQRSNICRDTVIWSNFYILRFKMHFQNCTFYHPHLLTKCFDLLINNRINNGLCWRIIKPYLVAASWMVVYNFLENYNFLHCVRNVRWRILFWNKIQFFGANWIVYILLLKMNNSKNGITEFVLQQFPFSSELRGNFHSTKHPSNRMIIFRELRKTKIPDESNSVVVQ